MCRMCRDPQYGLNMQKEILHQKYTQVFTFFFSKPINEILKNKNSHHVQVFKEYLFYDDEEEYLQGWASFNQLKEIAQKSHHIQPFLRDMKIFNTIKIVFTCRRKQSLLHCIKVEVKLHTQQKNTHTVNNPIEQKSLIQGSFLQDVDRHINLQNISFETTSHDVYNPEFSVDSRIINQELEESPIKKLPRSIVNNDILVQKKQHSDMGIPNYLEEKVLKIRKINTSSHTSFKRSFDTFVSTHHSQNTTKKIERVPNAYFQSLKNSFSLSQVYDVNQKQKPVGDHNSRISIIRGPPQTYCLKNFLNTLVFENANSKQSSSKSMQKNNHLYTTQKSKIIIDIKQFSEILQKEQQDELMKLNDHNHRNDKNQQLKQCKSYISPPAQNNRSISLFNYQSQNEIKPNQKGSQTQIINIQPYQRQKFKNIQSSPKTLTQVEKQQSLKILIQKYKSFILKSPLDKSSINHSPRQLNQQGKSSKSHLNFSINSSTQIRSDSKYPQEQFHIQGLQTKLIQSQKQLQEMKSKQKLKQQMNLTKQILFGKK